MLSPIDPFKEREQLIEQLNKAHEIIQEKDRGISLGFLHILIIIRFAFAKEIIQVRARSKSCGNPSFMTAGEENVLLSFGGNKNGGSGVTIVRKAIKPATMSCNVLNGVFGKLEIKPFYLIFFFNKISCSCFL